MTKLAMKITVGVAKSCRSTINFGIANHYMQRPRHGFIKYLRVGKDHDGKAICKELDVIY